MDETIEFFRKLLTKTEWNLRYAEGMGRVKDAENIKKRSSIINGRLRRWRK